MPAPDPVRDTDLFEPEEIARFARDVAALVAREEAGRAVAGPGIEPPPPAAGLRRLLECWPG